MSTSVNELRCPKCNQKILQSLSTRCMYCGAELPKELYASDDTRQEILARTEKANKAHDIAMADKQKNTKKSSKKKPPTEFDY